jgi:hypothetical protein
LIPFSRTPSARKKANGNKGENPEGAFMVLAVFPAGY